MAELPFWQLVAGSVGSIFVLIGVAGYVRLSSLPTLVVITSLLAIPTAGLFTFAVRSQPLTDLRVIYFALPFVVLAYGLLLANLLLALRRSESFASLHRRVPLFLVAWPSLVLVISLFLYILEPGFAIANLAANAAWFVAWTPRPFRRYHATTLYEIAAPASRVFAFITDPRNWPLYNPAVESVSVRPDGPVAVGSEIRIRQRVVYPGLRGPRLMLPSALETTSRVTVLDPDRAFATRRVDLPDSRDSVELSDSNGRTLVTTRADNVLAYRYAVLGARIRVGRSRYRILKLNEERQRRLRELLEQPAAQP